MNVNLNHNTRSASGKIVVINKSIIQKQFYLDEQKRGISINSTLDDGFPRGYHPLNANLPSYSVKQRKRGILGDISMIAWVQIPPRRHEMNPPPRSGDYYRLLKIFTPLISVTYLSQERGRLKSKPLVCLCYGKCVVYGKETLKVLFKDAIIKT